MSKYKAALFDADGVLIEAPKQFSQIYEQEQGLSPGSLIPFYKGPFLQALVGKADLKELIVQEHNLWHWNRNPQIVLDEWFAAENYPNQALIALIKKQQATGLMVCIATNQEKYRAQYLRNVMFPELFDKLFISSDIGRTKNDSGFFKVVIEELRAEQPTLKPEEIIYFDDKQSYLDAAATLGISTYLYQGVEQIERELT